MHQGIENALSLPRGFPTVRHKPPPLVNVPPGLNELPLIDGKTPDHKKIQEVWKAKVRVFDLGDTDDLTAYQEVWQRVSDGHAVMCEHRVEFSAPKGAFVALLRWADRQYNLPQDGRG